MKVEVNIDTFKSINRRMLILVVLMAITVFVTSFGVVVLREQLYTKDRVIGVTHDIDHALPFVYSLRDFSMRNEIVKLYEFVENVIYLVEDESVVNYYAVGRSSRNVTNLSASLRKASFLATGQAAQVFQEKYYKSSEIERRLRAENLAWELLIDCIDLQPWALGLYKVDVYGEVQVTKTHQSFRIPHESWDYVKISMTITSGPVWKTENGEILNKWGLYVTNYSKRYGLPARVRNSARRGCDFQNDRDITRGNL